MKNLFVNEKFICYSAMMNGDEVKKFLFLCYNYAINDIMPTDKELDNLNDIVYNSFSEYVKYIDLCKKKYENRIKKTLEEMEKSTKLFREITPKKDEDDFVGKIGFPTKKKNKKNEKVEGNFVGLINPNDNF